MNQADRFLLWTSITPTEPGLYQHCFQNSTVPGGLEYRVVRVVTWHDGKTPRISMEQFGDDRLLPLFDFGCWYGPMELPLYGYDKDKDD